MFETYNAEEWIPCPVFPDRHKILSMTISLPFDCSFFHPMNHLESLSEVCRRTWIACKVAYVNIIDPLLPDNLIRQRLYVGSINVSQWQVYAHLFSDRCN